ncbi:protein-export chaperone SecB [Vibrio cyclitrophicus]
MNLQLTSTKADSLALIENEVGHESQDGFGLDFGCAFKSEASNTFKVFFKTSVDVCSTGSEIPTHKLNVEYSAFFELDEDVNQEFMDSMFPKVNAPAIAYPYLRAFISTILLNAGYDPVILPSINFQAIANKSLQV